MRIVLLAGERGSGKTTALARLAAEARAAGFGPGGLLQPGVFAPDGSKAGSTWLDVATGETGDFGSKIRALGGPAWKDWSFSAAGLEAANRAAIEALERGADPVMVDELGPLELRARSGLSPALRAIESRGGTDLGRRLGPDPGEASGPLVVVAVRTELARELSARLGRAPVVAIDPSRREAALAELRSLAGLPAGRPFSP